jgi:HSP20 family protein
MADLKLWGETQISKMKRDMDRRFEALCADFGLPPARPFGEAGLTVDEEGDGLVVRVAAPGLDPQDIGVAVARRRVTITARRVTRTEGGLRAESFRKELYLPCAVAARDVAAQYRDGIIEIRIPRRAAHGCGLSRSTP